MKKKFIIIFVIVLIVAVAFTLAYYTFLNNFMKDNMKENKVEVLDKVKDYEIYDNATDYQKELFSNLKNILEKESVDEDEYAKVVSQLFLADFFTLDTKLTKNDIGGTMYVYTDYQSDFNSYAKETVYHDIKSNIYGDRKQDLPIVTNVEIVSFENKKFDYLNESDSNAYYIDLKISYYEDLEYQEDVSLVLIHNNDKIEVAKMN